MANPFRHHPHLNEPVHSSPMERVAEAVASGLGTVAFVVVSTTIIIVWILINATGIVKFDAYPFILLNLAFSAQAFYTGALVIIAQKAQSRFDKKSEEANAKHREELAQSQIQLLEHNTELTEQISKMTEQINKLTEEVHQHILQEKT